MNTDIAAEAASEIWSYKYNGNSKTAQIIRSEKIIQSAIEKATEETNAANCSLLALAAIVKGHPDTPESLKAIASKELLDHTRGAYLINELRTLRAAHASAFHPDEADPDRPEMQTGAAIMAAHASGEKWTGNGCCIRVPNGAIVCVKDKDKAKTLRDAHNQSLQPRENRKRKSQTGKP